MQTKGALGLKLVVGVQKMSREIKQRNSSSNRSPLTPPRILREFSQALLLGSSLRTVPWPCAVPGRVPLRILFKRKPREALHRMQLWRWCFFARAHWSGCLFVMGHVALCPCSQKAQTTFLFHCGSQGLATYETLRTFRVQ